MRDESLKIWWRSSKLLVLFCLEFLDVKLFQVMSFVGVFYIKKWCAEEERFFQFSKFLDQAIFEVFIRVDSFLFWITDIFFMVVHTMSEIFCFPFILFIADWTCK